MKLLTIAIPTFQRAFYLKKCLESLFLNKFDTNLVEILVLDNCSSDETEQVVLEFASKFELRYIKNHHNIGPDENFKKCLKEACSKYVWIFGDDDVFLQGSLEKILALLQDDFGLIHLKAFNFHSDNEKLPSVLSFDFEIFHSKEKFVKKAHTNLTFITANIVNRDIIFQNLDLDKIDNNNLGQLFWNLVCIKFGKCAVVWSDTIGARQFNRSGYDFCKVFVENFYDTLGKFCTKFDNTTFEPIFTKRILIFFMPASIIRIKSGLNNQNYNSCPFVLLKKFKFNIYFWLFTIWAIILPKWISIRILRLCERLKINRL